MAVFPQIQGAAFRPVTGPAGPTARTIAPARGEAPRAEPHATPAPPAANERREELDAALAELGAKLAAVRPEPYSVSIKEDEESGHLVIRIKDAAGEVVKQFPPEKILNLHQKMDDLVGMIVDETT